MPSEGGTIAEADYDVMTASAVRLRLATELRDRFGPILPDINGRIAGIGARNEQEMLAVVCDVVRAIVAGHLGAEPNSKQVYQFIEKASSEPAFAARSMRLLAESCRTPTTLRRRMLALALFRAHPDPEIRDQIDAAMERLQFADVELLRFLVDADDDGFGFHVGVDQPDQEKDRLDQMSFGRSRFAHIARRSFGDDSRKVLRSCSVSSVMRLRSTECIELSSASATTLVNGPRMFILNRLDVLQLGRDLLDALKEEREIADGEDGRARGAR